MLFMPSQIDVFKEMCTLSAEMVDAAQAQDWDRLVALEDSVSKLRDTLQGSDDNAGLDTSGRELKASLIQRILDDDAEIRRHTEPWMDHVRHFLGSTTRRHRIENAYGKGIDSLGGGTV